MNKQINAIKKDKFQHRQAVGQSARVLAPYQLTRIDTNYQKFDLNVDDCLGKHRDKSIEDMHTYIPWSSDNVVNYRRVIDRINDDNLVLSLIYSNEA